LTLNQFKQNKKRRNITKCKKISFHFLRTKSGTFKTTDLQIGTSGLKSEGSDTHSENSEEDFLEQYEKIAYEDLEISKKKLGSGATASVYKVRYGKKFYALKVYLFYLTLFKVVGLYNDDSLFSPKLIISEVKTLYQSMSCPYVVKFHQAFHREGSIQLLLEYMDCGSLEDVYKLTMKVPEDVLSEITSQVQFLKFLNLLKVTPRFRLFEQKENYSQRHQTFQYSFK
jgi:hypothetical protein